MWVGDASEKVVRVSGKRRRVRYVEIEWIQGQGDEEG